MALAVAILEEDDVAAGLRPAIERGDVAIGDAGDGSCGSEIVDPRHEQVAHAVDRRQPGQVPAIRRNGDAAIVGIIEQDATGDLGACEAIDAARVGERASEPVRRHVARPIENIAIGALACTGKLGEAGDHVRTECRDRARLAGETAEPHEIAP